MSENDDLVEWTEQRLNRRYLVSRMGRLGLSISAAGAALGVVAQVSAEKSTPRPTPTRTPAPDSTELEFLDWEEMGPYKLLLWTSGDGYYLLNGLNFSNGQVRIEVCDKSGGCNKQIFDGSHDVAGPDFWRTTWLRPPSATRQTLVYACSVTAVDLATGNRSNTLHLASYGA